ncbi:MULTISPECIES: dual specificity protein phosphatase family protein [Pseudoalteromonas]|uniref:Tyrosine specific protein phosphatases domain-containing protein n=1 Tax=Pseudoalteromonas luteoviolacea (strain 2ta16) TaxID=1353533 RepID=V4JAM1_PSEL2|nr:MULTISPECIES: dual specificity protein phosphatase family protein [Pseudoalteromonas]ESP92227.1 putative protein-tyrosine phosphatase [Pseudoalteromonas luteoviolacea 2ta16]KZN29335.1 hypothetical protein N483_07825 [Pseudoalteromonas luteoviolacea NCIMB 1944]MCG7549335.1 dual specificity protein phosphatase family protein [Pseudoalteromonas sp. Of7M-16]
MQTHPFDKLALNNGGTFIFTPCPGTKEVPLIEAVEQLKCASVQAVVTLMYDNEMEKNGAQGLPLACEKLALQWFQLPLPDDDAPNQDFTDAFNTHVNAILSIVEQKGTVAVHCKGGSGRTGLVIALLMKRLGYDHQAIIEQVQLLRPKALKHPVQKAFFDEF